MNNWREINYTKVRTYQLGEEPELIYVIPVGAERYLAVVHDDAYDLDAGKVEIVTPEYLEKVYGITL